MDNVWSWDEEERKRREQAAPLQGIQYRAGGEAPPPQYAPAQKTDPLTQYAQSKVIGAGDKALMNGAESIWKDIKLNNQIANEAGLDAAYTPPTVASADVGAPLGNQIASNSITPVATDVTTSAATDVLASGATDALAGAATDTLATAAADTVDTAGTTALAEGAALGGAELGLAAAVPGIGWGLAALMLAKQGYDAGLFG